MKISEEILRAVAQLEIRARRNMTALLAGNYRSAFRGSGMQFKEFRHYEAGDDIRHMSWAVTARTGRATVKIFEEERELDVILMVDVSGSSLFGHLGKRRVDMYAELVVLMGLAAVRSGDNVGMMLFNDKPVYYLPPRRTQNNVLAGVTHLMAQPFHHCKSDLRAPFLYAQKVLRNRSLIIVLSDFLAPDFETEIKALSRKHELCLLHCYDDAERGSGISGVYEVWDPETGEFLLLDANSKQTRRTLALHQTKLRNSLEELSRSSKADYLALSVEDDYLQRLIYFFKQRGPSRL